MAQYATKQDAHSDPVPRLTDAHAKSYVTIGLLAINLIVFLAMIFSGASPINPGVEVLGRFGGSWGRALSYQPWRLLTANYVHAGIIHIAFNMWCLWDLGGLAERIFDRWIYFLIYTSCGLAGSLAAAWWDPMAITVGASGAIFGIAGALISALYLGKLPVSKQAIQSTLKSLLFFAGFNLFYGAAISSSISNSAHIGGLVTGLALGAAMAPSLTSPASKRQGWALAVFAGAAIVLLGGFTFVRHSQGGTMSMEKGLHLLENGRSDEAIRYFETVVSGDPTNKRALVLLGNAYLQKEQYEKATVTFGRALQLDPYDSDTQFCMGFCLLKLGKNQQAVESLEKAVLLNPHDADAENTLGQAYQAVGNKDAAQSAFHRAEELKKSPSPKI